MSSFYEWQLALLSLSSCALFFLRRCAPRNGNFPHDTDPDNVSRRKAATLTRRYLCAYAVVNSADWLQGPYLYSLYREQYKLPERIIALLFVVGYSTGGISSPLVGKWADEYGRKQMTMISCLTYALSTLLINIPLLPLLFIGRLLSGFSASIHSICFDSWLVSSANTLSLSSRDLSDIFSHAALVNSLVATAAGITSDKLVEWSGSFVSPFVASGILLLPGLAIIALTWSENYGKTSESSRNVLSMQRLVQASKLVISDRRLLALCLIQTCFEGSLHLFIFAWVPLLQEVASSTTALPLGYIFSSFMLSMLLGSLVYSSIISLSRLDVYHDSEDLPSSSHSLTLSLHAKLSASILAASAATFVGAVVSESEHVRFWAFCAFEGCVGMYYPVQGMLRGRLVSDEHRATLSALIRIPLNVFVLVALVTGVASARHVVLVICAAFLLCTAAVVVIVLVRQSPEHRNLEAYEILPSSSEQ